MMQKDVQHKILKEYLEANMRIWYDNFKMDLNETIYYFQINSSAISKEKSCNFVIVIEFFA